jgi:transposase
MRTDKENIKAYILTQIGRGEKRYAVKTVEAFGVSKASVYSYVKELETDGIILKNGNK